MASALRLATLVASWLQACSEADVSVPESALDEAGAKFMQFFHTLGGDAPAVELALFPGAARGVRAAEAFQPGDVVCTIPMSIVIHIGQIARDAELGQDLAPLITSPSLTRTLGHEPLPAEETRRMKMESGIAIWLAYQRDQGARSDVHPYVSLLPDAEHMPDPLRWADHPATANALQASQLREHLDRLNANLTDELSLFKRHAKSSWAKSLTFDDFRWAATNVARRSFMMQIKIPDSGWMDVPCLPPLADLFNTGPSSQINTECTTNSNSTALVCFAMKAIRKGEQLLVPYAVGTDSHNLGDPFVELKQSDLLRDYGFTVPPHSSWVPAPESVPLALPPLPSVACKGRCLTFAAQWDITVSQLAPHGLILDEAGVVSIPPIRRQPDPNTNHGDEGIVVPGALRWIYAYALLAGKAELALQTGVTDALHRGLRQFAASGKLDLLVCAPPCPQQEPPEIYAAAARALRALHAARIVDYGTTLEADNRKLSLVTGDLEGTSRDEQSTESNILKSLDSSGRSALVDALRVRIAEKETLGWLEDIALQLEQLSVSDSRGFKPDL